MSTKKSTKQNNSYVVALKYFVLWRIFLFATVFFAVQFLPLQNDFLGGGMTNYQSLPWFWSWVNFDGEHYLAIARQGYQPLTHFYFPAYPLLVYLFAKLTNQSLFSYAATGLIINNALAYLALVGLHKLVKLDQPKQAGKTLLLLLAFPTSFFLASFYTESLFLALAVWSFYFARRSEFYKSALLITISTAARVVGSVLALSLLIEIYQKHRFNKLKYLPLLITPLGIFAYMYYLLQTTGDPLVFLSTVGIFGDQRSTTPIMLPQVYYRYVFKILPNVWGYLPALFTTWLEFISTTFFLAIIILSFKKMRASYWSYLLLGFLIPTFSGSFSSMPRYLLVLFPAFIYLSNLLNKKGFIKYLYVVLSIILLTISTAMFARGYWIS